MDEGRRAMRGPAVAGDRWKRVGAVNAVGGFEGRVGRWSVVGKSERVRSQVVGRFGGGSSEA